jgi:hypothetical protein
LLSNITAPATGLLSGTCTRRTVTVVLPDPAGWAWTSSALPAGGRQHLAVRRPRCEREDVPCLAAVRLLPAAPLVDQSTACRLCLALGDRGGSFHWMLQHEGLVNGVLSAMFGIDGPICFDDRWLALGSNIVVYIWKWMPFWTLIFPLRG